MEIKLGWGVCGSFCSYAKLFRELEKPEFEIFDISPVFSFAAAGTNTRFGTAGEHRERVEKLCGRKIVETIEGAEPFGPARPMDVFLVAPCTGNTIAKLASGVTDTPVTMACKAHLRNERPLVLAVATNDGLSGNAKNIAALLCRKNVFFVPFGQDDPQKKPASLVADFSKTYETIAAALDGRQLQPILL